ncbi:MAG: efflux RND transporter periplasmic adaptor subunit [Gemmatimonadetes bacterium]|nr:efflux RND transporter periplasmic adaptor subunit [Gemmatimonadota bacterium]
MRVYSPMLVTAQEELLLAQRLVGDVAGGAPDAQAGAADLVASARRRLAYWDIQADEIAAIERSGQPCGCAWRSPTRGCASSPACTPRFGSRGRPVPRGRPCSPWPRGAVLDGRADLGARPPS